MVRSRWPCARSSLPRSLIRSEKGAPFFPGDFLKSPLPARGADAKGALLSAEKGRRINDDRRSVAASFMGVAAFQPLNASRFNCQRAAGGVERRHQPRARARLTEKKRKAHAFLLQASDLGNRHAAFRVFGVPARRSGACCVQHGSLAPCGAMRSIASRRIVPYTHPFVLRDGAKPRLLRMKG